MAKKQPTPPATIPPPTTQPAATVPPPNPLPQAHSRPKWRRWFRLSAVVMVLIMSVLSFDYGISGDEYDMAEYGKAATRFYTSFGSDTSAYTLKIDRDKVFKYYGGVFDIPAAAIQSISPLSEYDTRHLLNAWVGWAAMLCTGLLTALLGGWRAGVAALWLIFLSPSFFGHSMNNPKDIPFALGFVLAGYGLLRLYQQMPQPTRGTLLLVAGGIAIAIGSRVGGLLLFGYLGLVLLVHAWQHRQRAPIGRYIAYGSALAAAGFFGGLLLWPYGLQDPIAHTLETFRKMSHFSVGLRELFEGRQIQSDKLPWYYLPKYLLITSTPLLLVGVALAIAQARTLVQRIGTTPVLLVAFMFIFPLSYIITTDANVYGGWRHVLFTYPFIVVLGALGWEHLVARQPTNTRRWAAGAAYGLLSLPAIIWYGHSHPHQYTYFNALVGGLDRAHTQYETDYYYNAMKAGARWLRQQPEIQRGDTVVVATNAFNHVSTYFRGQGNVKVVYSHYFEKEMKNWDYGVFSYKFVGPRQMENGVWPPTTTVHRVGVGPATYCAVIRRPEGKYDLEAARAMNQRRYDTALPLMRRYLQQDSSNVNALQLLGSYYLQRATENGSQFDSLRASSLDSAYYFAERALHFDPDYVTAWVLKGQTLSVRGRYDESNACYDRAITLKDNYYLAYYFKGINLAQTGNARGAIDQMNLCLNNGGARFKQAYLVAAQLYRQTGDTNKAQQYEQAAAQMK